MHQKYVLNGRNPVKCDDTKAWLDFWSNNFIRVNKTTVEDCWVSTIAQSIDVSYGNGPPQLFETRAFGGPLNEECTHCATWEEAEAMHDAMIERVRKAYEESKA